LKEVNRKIANKATIRSMPVIQILHTSLLGNPAGVSLTEACFDSDGAERSIG